ncbi:sigma-54 interaction domain-containing protein [Effusibacillus lacus]|uniref:HTH-type transcriptional regulatory protein TyrR n=1 Tax=Effusibacillus lacus TaxID=1348429 RepID=A0A292YKJ1_9BACL|nr:sigma 54-interacting transcriptional regulator [Effusibacillus lacus]TCS75543.1 PAS domain S-box-containing protein/TyrR family helix-turn-helix protein [Effusibacillus lacus]GAX89005.1 transcriptional regulator [Effusibacillus lacus]
MSYLKNQESDEFTQIINSSFDGIVIVDANGIILFQNPAYEKITGLKAKDCVGRHLQDLIDEGMIDQSVSLRVLQEQKPLTIVQKIITGKKVLVSGVPIMDTAGNIQKVMCNIRDLTTLNQLEKEIIELEKQNQRVNRELEELKEKQDAKNAIVAHDPKMKAVVERALRVAQINSAVLIQGESGVGKEGIVNLIHQYSNRNDKPLVRINCGAIPEQLLESELFGYESGSFTGASHKGKPGLFEVASKGTLFLDEIGEMPLQLQVKLLRVLQEYEITRIGGVKPIKVDVRIIAATNRNLDDMVAEGKFREDLYYRLNIIPIYVPPLRERKDDIIPLVYHFLNKIKHTYGVNRMFTRDALESFRQYDWPGNVRELQNLVERVSLMVNKPLISLTDIKKEVKTGLVQRPLNHTVDHVKKEFLPLKEQVEEFEQTLIKKALEQFPSIRQAAKALQIDQSTLLRKMQKYQIQKDAM